MLNFSSQTLFEFSTYVDILLIDDVPFLAVWKSNDKSKVYEYINRVLTIKDSEFGTRQLIITDSFINHLKFLYNNQLKDLILCVLNQNKLQLKKLDM